MAKYKKILFTTILAILVLLYADASRERSRYQEYLASEDQKILQTAYMNIRASHDILKDRQENGAITRSDLSLLGLNAQNIRTGLIRLQAESGHFLSEKDYDHEAYNILAGYFDGISLFISMDLFDGQGNVFPHLEDPTLVNLDEKEKVLEHMLLISDLLLSHLQASEITIPDDMGGDQSLSHKKELSNLMTTVKSMSEDLDAYLVALQAQPDQSELTLKFLEEVVYKY